MWPSSFPSIQPRTKLSSLPRSSQGTMCSLLRSNSANQPDSSPRDPHVNHPAILPSQPAYATTDATTTYITKIKPAAGADFCSRGCQKANEKVWYDALIILLSWNKQMMTTALLLLARFDIYFMTCIHRGSVAQPYSVFVSCHLRKRPAGACDDGWGRWWRRTALILSRRFYVRNAI